ncbi:nucleotidyltransferase family protein [Psychroserpens luteus]|uniref:NTP transferase domain-containing protein n=1 Tax=Psychroserpens luteus TaxID=1434066 RepID=A0ABW5ZTU2_9FLAO|nr:nucleotidyltransferase family protein [Psychroserpens luteus]
MNVAILMLSAGSSTRMGSTKQLLPIGNKTLLGLSIENALQTNAKKVFCVLGSNAENIKNSISQYDIEIIINPNFKEGLSSSIVEGLNHIDNTNFDAVLIMLSDQPKIDSNYINLLILSSEKHPTQIIASQYEKTIGVPVIFPKKYFKQLQQLEGDKGAKDFLNIHKAQVISIKSDKLIDIDTQEDYLNFLKSL